MEEILKGIGGQIPNIVAFIVLVIIFLRHINEKEASAREAAKDWKEVVHRNSIALDRNTEMFGHASAVFGRVENGHDVSR